MNALSKNQRDHLRNTARQRPLSQSNVVHLPAIDAPKFAQWLRGQFASPEVVAQVFQVRNSTAWNWWNGDNRASGDAVARTFLMFPQALAWFVTEWEARR